MSVSAGFRSLPPRSAFCGLSLLLLLVPVAVLAAAPGLQVVVLEGDGAINNIKARTAHDPVVEVRDEQDKVIAGANVVFQTPSTGPSAEFGDGMRSFITQTDAEGHAAAHGLRPNSVTGRYEIRVTASFQSQTASAVITQTNAAPAEARSSKKFWIIGLAAGAAAGGAFAAAHGGKSASNATTPSSSTAAGAIVAGSPSFGPPH